MNPRAGFIQPTPLAGEPLRPLGYFRRSMVFYEIGGESGIRTHGDLRLAGFQDRFLQPLGHLSIAERRLVLNTCSMIPHYNFICQHLISLPPQKVFSNFFDLGVAFSGNVCYYYQAASGCSAVGSALDWGSRGREFKSRHSDQSECPNLGTPIFMHVYHSTRIIVGAGVPPAPTIFIYLQCRSWLAHVPRFPWIRTAWQIGTLQFAICNQTHVHAVAPPATEDSNADLFNLYIILDY